MTEALDNEIEAIRQVLAAMQPLGDTARKSVLDYVVKRLQIELSTAPAGAHDLAITPPAGSAGAIEGAEGSGSPVHIETLKDEKSPRSANEMAALVAYYLLHVAPESDRKSTITTQDIETYFKIAKFPLPRTPRVTLQNARNAGYFDSVGDGEYRLNPVGYNLVAHSMPRGAKKSAPARRKKGAKKKAARKKKGARKKAVGRKKR